MNRVALVAITKHGAALAGRLQAAWPESDVYVAERFLANVGPEGAGPGRRIPFPGSVKGALPGIFSGYDGIVLFVSLGAVVRLIAPLLGDKHNDPAVVVIDDRAVHAISVLSGHLGGANDLAREAAAVLGARPVITTASDVGGTIAVDLFGREFGWTIETVATVTAVSAAVVNEERVAVVQEAGEPGWWPPDRPLPPAILPLRSAEEALSALREGRIDAALIVTHRRLGPEFADLLRRAVVYRPRTLVVGVGCNRGTSREEIAAAVRAVLAEAGLSEASVRNLATIDLKRDEPGLVEFARSRGWPLTCYPAEVLNQVEFPNRSETVYRFTGAYGVAEPAALLSAGAGRLLVEKVARGNVTLAVAAVNFAANHNPSRAETEESRWTHSQAASST